MRLELFRNRKRPDPSTLPDIAAAAALILAGDAERVLRRATELPTNPTIQIDLRPDDETTLRKYFYEPVQQLLQQQAIRIIPLDWECSNVVII
jgi:hypothetical protein